MNGRIGELCAGYGGLGMAVREVLGGEIAWVADSDPDVSAILACRFPSAPNHGDITTTDWAAVEPVDVLTAGFPCQDVSCAGGRAGLREGNRTGVWAHVARAIDELRPSLVVLENVRGLLSAGADSDVEPCPWCVGEAGNEHPLRACGAVLGDLAGLFYDTRGMVVSAAAAGAPHRRERVFILAWPAADADDNQQDKPASADRTADERAAARRPILRIGGCATADTAGARCGGSQDAGTGCGDANTGARGGEPQRDGHAPAADAPVSGRMGRGSRHLAGISGTPAAPQRPGRLPAQYDGITGEGFAAAEDADGTTRGERRFAAPGQAPGGWSRADAGRPGGAPVPADARSAGLEIGAVEPDRDERPAAERGRGDAVADAPGDGRDEGRPEPAGIVGGPDAAECGDGPTADATGGTGRLRDGDDVRARRGADGRGPAAGGGAVADTHGGRRGPAEQNDVPRQPDPDRGIAADACGARLGQHPGEPPAEEAGPLAGDEPPGDRGLRPAPEWGPYTLAIRRWEAVLGRPAPRPTEPGRTGERLSPRFVEWMQGLPEGWVTGVPGLSRNAQLKALGNGVVPQQAAMALRTLLARADILPTAAAGQAAG